MKKFFTLKTLIVLWKIIIFCVVVGVLAMSFSLIKQQEDSPFKILETQKDNIKATSENIIQLLNKPATLDEPRIANTESETTTSDETQEDTESVGEEDTDSEDSIKINLKNHKDYSLALKDNLNNIGVTLLLCQIELMEQNTKDYRKSIQQ
ncbi:hypothetical protein [uncultured Helicobacter sp.]|uniref:hypothetical protein n=1 Tax=uncultured Helicobacter sp. TaxID=175537 RepID=UPI003751D7D6